MSSNSTEKTIDGQVAVFEAVDEAQLKKQQELELQMAQLELETENIEESDTSIDRSLRMLNPQEVEQQKLEKQRANRTKAQKQRDLHKLIQNKRSDRSPMTEDQRPKDARGRKIPNSMRLTKDKMNQLQSGQLGISNKGPVNADNLTPEQLERASKMLESNPQLK